LPVIDSRGTQPIVQSGDLAFLQQKEQEGKLKSSEGTLSTTGDLTSITAGINKDLYLSSATITANNGNTGNAVRELVVELKFNGVTVEKWSPARVLFGGGTGSSWQENNYKFIIGIGKKVSAGEIIKLEITSNGASSFTVNGALQAWEESSGSQSFGGQTVTFQTEGGDLSFLRDRERAGDLVKILSPEFSADADQVTFVPPNGKTFFFSRSRLYPVTNVAIGNVNTNTLQTRQTDVEITNDGTVIDVLTYNENARVAVNTSMGQLTGQFESNIFDSLIGDGIKEFKLVSTNTSGTYRVSLFGWLEDT